MFPRQDGNSGLEVTMTGCRKTRQIPAMWSHGRVQESCSVGEISNMFDTLPTHHAKPGNNN